MVSMKEAMFYRKLSDDVVQCRLCNHFCAIKPGKRGICGVRENISGTLFSLVYGKVIADSVDPIEKKPLFHFLPGTLSYSVATAGCNFSCDFCQNWEISQVSRTDGGVRGCEVSPEEIVDRAIDAGCASIAYTYTEPTVFFEYAYDIMVIAHKRGLKNVFVSNGFMSREAIDKIAPYLDGINVDLKGFSDEFYRKVVGGRLKPVLDNIRYLHELGIWVEVTTLIVPGHNEDDASLSKIAKFVSGVGVDVPWHVSRFFPHFKMKDVSLTPVDVLYRAYEIGTEAGVKYIYVGNLPGGEFENTVCPKCGKVVVERSGFEVSEIRLKNGKCGFCGESISGVWE